MTRLRYGVRTLRHYVCGLSLVDADRLLRRCRAHGVQARIIPQ
ncbi:hypothetical protein [Enterovirga sp. CN4-39]